MDIAQSTQITVLLKAWSGGDHAALERLAPLISGELQKVARHYMRAEGRPGHTLQTTALVNEAWVRLVGAEGVDWQDRVHFYAVAAQIMRRILVDAARARRSGKRGGDVPRVHLDDGPEIGRSKDRELMALDDALNALAQIDPRQVRVIELRFFVGLGVEETAEVLKISPQSVKRDWKLAKIWLSREMRGVTLAEQTGMS
jgi:RNA polymerase sigma factor (TIGR02999 family)